MIKRTKSGKIVLKLSVEQVNALLKLIGKTNHNSLKVAIESHGGTDTWEYSDDDAATSVWDKIVAFLESEPND